MIKIEKNIPITKGGRPRKYKEYIDAFDGMGLNESFLVNDYKIVDSVRRYAWKQKIPCKFRTIAKNSYRIYKVNESCSSFTSDCKVNEL